VAETALALAGFVGAAMLFTPSSCFANPAVTLAQTLTETFAGIAPSSVPPFLAVQLAGALVAVACDLLLLAPTRTLESGTPTSDERG
jgi:glycerol uptake facilitator-like aquaporin